MEDFYGIKMPEKDPFYDFETPTEIFVPPQPAFKSSKWSKSVEWDFESLATNRCRRAQFLPQTDMEKKRFEVQFYPRLYRQEILFKELNRVISYFHGRIKYLHDMRVKMEIEGKVKTVALLSLVNELDLAKEFNAQEQTITEILRVQKAEMKSAKHHVCSLNLSYIK